MRGAAAVAQLAAASVVLSGLAACGPVNVRPEPKLPKPLLQPLPVTVGLIIPPETRSYLHKETRYGVDWRVVLGPGHVRMLHDVFADEFEHVEEFKDLEAARSATDLKAVFEPRIDTYSFVTARETGGRYYAVTIRYRITLYTPAGDKSDGMTLTGYGNSLAKGMKSATPLLNATAAAMRDAAAKFLVQFPAMPSGQKLAHNEAVAPEAKVAVADNLQIEAVPIDEPEPDPTATASGAAASGAAPAPPADPTPAAPTGSGSTPATPPASAAPTTPAAPATPAAAIP
jgi:hypothetical protein